MAKWRCGRKHAAPALPPLAAPVAMLTLLFAPQCRAELTFAPGVELRETYTDNVKLEAAGLQHSQFITELTPTLTIADDNPRLKLHAAYQLHNYAYSNDKLAGMAGSQRHFEAGGKAVLLQDTLFVDGNGSIARQAISAFGPQINDNVYANQNQSEVKSWRISPYLLHRFGNTANVELRYGHDVVDSNSAGFGRSVSDIASLSIASGAAFRALGWNLLYNRNNLDDALAKKSSSSSTGLNLRWRLGQSFSLTGMGGYDQYDYKALGGKTAGKSWSAGFLWTPSLRTSLQASAGKRYFGSSYALTVLHRSRRTVWNLNYNDAVTTSRAQFLLPATIDTSALLDRLLAPTYPDPLARRQAVDAYIRATGLPSALANNINYFSNRYILQKQFQASAGFNTARTTTVFSLFETKRNALSAQQSDSALLGSNRMNLNDNTGQKGASLLISYQVSPRTRVNLSGTVTRAESLSTGTTDDNKALRMTMTREFQARLKGALEVRRVQGSSALQSGHNYRENAISATLSMQL